MSSALRCDVAHCGTFLVTAALYIDIAPCQEKVNTTRLPPPNFFRQQTAVTSFDQNPLPAPPSGARMAGETHNAYFYKYYSIFMSGKNQLWRTIAFIV